MDLNKFTSAGTLRLVTKATLKAADFSLMIGRLDFSQFLPGVALCRNITPTKLSQPNNIKLLKSKIVKITRDIIGITLQCRVYARTHAKDAAVRRMDCERDESLDGDCMLERCGICLVDNKVKMLDDILSQICTDGKSHDDLDKALELFESLCNDGRKDPIVIVSNGRWIACFNKIAFELMRLERDIL